MPRDRGTEGAEEKKRDKSIVQRENKQAHDREAPNREREDGERGRNAHESEANGETITSKLGGGEGKVSEVLRRMRKRQRERWTEG